MGRYERDIQHLDSDHVLRHTHSLLHPNSARVLAEDFLAMRNCMQTPMDEDTDMRIGLWRTVPAADMPDIEKVMQVVRGLYQRHHRLQGTSNARANMLADLWLEGTKNLLLLRRVWILLRGLPPEAREVFWGKIAELPPLRKDRGQ